MFNFSVFTPLDWVAFVALSVLVCTAFLAWLDWITGKKVDSVDYDRYTELASRHISKNDLLPVEKLHGLKVATTQCGQKVLTDKRNNVVQYLGGS